MRWPLDPLAASCGASLTRRMWLAAAAGFAVPAGAALPDVVAAIRPSVLPVGTFNATDSPRFSFRGTGFVVGDGTQLVTNFHVLPAGAEADGGPRLAVLLARGGDNAEVRLARVQATDRNRDLALLKFDGGGLQPLTLGAVELAREGSSVAFTGYPIGGILGFSPVTHQGIISSVARIALPAATAQQLNERTLSRLREGPFEIYQIDAVAYPGNSGGPVFDVHSGQVVGVINMVLVRSTRESALTNPTGITYAIPVRFVHELLSGR